mgnify:CR=1 FL=1
MAYTLVPYHAPLRPVHLSFVYVTAHEKVPETKKGDDGVLLYVEGPDEVYGALSCAAYKLRINFCCQV